MSIRISAENTFLEATARTGSPYAKKAEVSALWPECCSTTPLLSFCVRNGSVVVLIQP